MAHLGDPSLGLDPESLGRLSPGEAWRVDEALKVVFDFADLPDPTGDSPRDP